MSQFLLVTTEKLERVEIKWNICFICQQVTSETVITPAKKPGIFLSVVV